MADPFEVRMRFTSQLQHLNASVTSSQKAAQYALKYRDMDEDLHSCILEQLEREELGVELADGTSELQNSMNTRANIMYFIEHLCDMAQKEGHMEFVRMIQRDILRVVDAVAPGDGSGAANVKVVRRVLSALHQKSLLLPQTLTEIEACLNERDHPPPAATTTTITTHHHAPRRSSNNNSNPNTNGTIITTTAIRLDKRQIEQRIEEDRERHKRLRESIWAVEAEGDGEFERLWTEGSEVGEDDVVAGEEDRGERKRGRVG